MEQTLSSLTYKGSVPEAISEARKQRKLFVVYISGEDVESSNLESSTWTDQKVADAISNYCILLHLSEGSNDAAQFSAIFVGFNGIQLWQNGGFVSGEVLASSLEKVWLSLHIQESTAAVLTAALASKTSEPSTSVNASTAPSEAESSTVLVKPLLTKEPSESLDAKAKAKSGKRKEISDANTVEDKGGEAKNVPSKSVQADNVGSSTSGKSTKSGKEPQRPNSVTNGPSSRSRRTVNDAGHGVRISDGGPKLLNNAKANQAVQDPKDEAIVEDKKDVTIDKSSDVHLNIRMPHGSNLQEKFPVTSTLRMVKQFVDDRKETAFGPYDLAIPYPRKVYEDQDLSRSLSELGLFDRQALIVVPRQRTTTRSNSRTVVELTSESNAGYFSYVKRILSFVNPFSYLGGGPTSTDSAQQYQRVPSERNSETVPHNNFPTPPRAYSAVGGSSSRSRQPTTSRIGSNIHTLKRDEDDEQFKDRNSFWNGNSTEYGGNDNGK